MSDTATKFQGTPQTLREVVLHVILKMKRPDPVKSGSHVFADYLKNRFTPLMLQAEVDGKPEIRDALERALNHCLEGYKS